MAGSINAYLFAPVLLLALANGRTFGDEALLKEGGEIYRSRCAACHGAAGEGVAKHYRKPLVGTATIAELSELISETMPEDEPDACSGRDAVAVATYIHGAFYSKPAQLPRRRLARLTGPQLRQSLADLYGRFAGTVPYSDKYGLRGKYFDGSNLRRDKRKIERIDKVVEFDFEDKGPGEGIKANEFSIQWAGGLKIDVTGRYEVIIRSTCAFVCYLGSYDREFINNYVQSGDKSEFRRSLVLTAGRVYPLKIWFQQRKRKTKQPPARVSLSWIPPYGTEQVIPSRNLLAENVPAAFALQTKLPPDDRSYGYERGIAVDRLWDDSTTVAAIEFAEIAADELWPRFRQSQPGGAGEKRGALRGFLTEVVGTAFRGPLDDTMRKLYVDDPVDATEDDAGAIRRSLLVSLKSPRFLYPLLDGHRSPSQRGANRLALTLHDSLPVDSWLISQTANGKLETENELRVAAERMVSDYRTRGKTREMLYAWLDLDHIGQIEKDEDLLPDFDAALVSDLRASLDGQLDEIVWSPASDYRQLMRADWVYTNDRLHRFLGPAWKPASPGNGMRRSVSAPHQRVGLIVHPYLMSGLAYRDSTSPIHRGVFVLRHMLGRTLRPPQEAFTPLNPNLHPKLTTRERISLQTSPKNCQKCHARINAIGFTLENFDAAGRFRLKEKGREIDVGGEYTARNGQRIKLEGPRSLAEYLASSDDAHRAFVERVFEHFVKQPAAAYGAATLDMLIASFRENDFNIRRLLVEIAVVAAGTAKKKTDKKT
ncbi:MAG: DUF1588 domain-containing protein [Pirellulales bacterium]